MVFLAIHGFTHFPYVKISKLKELKASEKRMKPSTHILNQSPTRCKCKHGINIEIFNKALMSYIQPVTNMAQLINSSKKLKSTSTIFHFIYEYYATIWHKRFWNFGQINNSFNGQQRLPIASDHQPSSIQQVVIQFSTIMRN